MSVGQRLVTCLCRRVPAWPDLKRRQVFRWRRVTGETGDASRRSCDGLELWNSDAERHTSQKAQSPEPKG